MTRSIFKQTDLMRVFRAAFGRVASPNRLSSFGSSLLRSLAGSRFNPARDLRSSVRAAAVAYLERVGTEEARNLANVLKGD